MKDGKGKFFSSGHAPSAINGGRRGGLGPNGFSVSLLRIFGNSDEKLGELPQKTDVELAAARHNPRKLPQEGWVLLFSLAGRPVNRILMLLPGAARW